MLNYMLFYHLYQQQQRQYIKIYTNIQADKIRMSSRLGKQVQHKTKQAQKLLQMLKQKRQKKKQSNPNQPQLQPQPQPQFHSSTPKKLPSPPSNSSDSFRTCENVDTYLGQLFFKIFSQHMVDPSQAVIDLQNCFQNMRKQIVKLNDEVSFSKQLYKTNIDKCQKQKAILIQANTRLNKDIENLHTTLQKQKNKYQQLLAQRKSQMHNNSAALNTSLVYDIYEQKIKQLSNRLQNKQQQLSQIWDKNRKYQQSILNIQKQKCNIERQNQQNYKQKQILVNMIEKLSQQIQEKQRRDNVGRNKEIVGEQIDNIKDKYQKYIAELNSLFDGEKKVYIQQINKLKQQMQIHKGKIANNQSYLNSIKSQQQNKSKQTQSLTQKIKTITQCNTWLQNQLNSTKQKLLSSTNQLKLLKQANTTIQNQLNTKAIYYNSLIKNNNDNISQLSSKNYQLQQQLKQHTKKYEDKAKVYQSLIKQSQTTNKQLTQKLQQLTQHHENYKKQQQNKYQQLRNSSQQKQQQLLQLMNVTTQLTQQLTKAKQQLQQYQNRIQVIKQSNVQLMQIRQNNKIYIQELDNKMKSMFSNWKDNQSNMRNQIQDKDRIIEKLEQELGICKKQCENLKQQNSKILIQKNKDKQLADKVIYQNIQQLSKYKQEISKITQQLQQCTNIISHLQQQLQQAKNDKLQLLTTPTTQKQQSNKNQAIQQLISNLKHQLSNKKQTIQNLSIQIKTLNQKIDQLTKQSNHTQQQHNTLQNKYKVLQQQKNKQNNKYIRTIQSLTQQLNDAYIKVNQNTRISLQKDQHRNNVSKDKNNRDRSVNKFKEYFGFGNRNQQ